MVAMLIVGVLSPTVFALQPPSGDDKAVRQTAAAFTTAFNKGDAKAVAALWTADGDYSVGRNSVKGRDEIQKLYETFFKQHPGSKMEIKVESVRVLAPTVAMEKGTATVRPFVKVQTVRRPLASIPPFTSNRETANG
jgi:uncharacterized protein (TIGR02246 family)